jgi:putative endonuclease
MYYVYIIRTLENKLYIGQTNNPERRYLEHYLDVKGAKFLHDNRATINMVYCEKFDTRKAAMMREKQLKSWTRAKKEALITGNLELLKKLS